MSVEDNVNRWGEHLVDDIWKISMCLTMDNKFKINCVNIDTGQRGG